MRKHKEQELVLKTDIMKESGWLYFLDKDGYLCRGRLCPPSEKLLKTNIQREKGWLYFCKEGEENPLEIWRTKMERNGK